MHEVGPGDPFVCHLDVVAATNGGQLDPAWAPSATTPGVLELAFDGELAGVDGTSVLVVREDFDAATFGDDIPKLVRLTATGAMDASFSSDGVLDLPDRFQSSGDAFVSGGAYYLVGRLTNDDFQTYPAAVKVLSSGSVDASFGTAGVALGVPRGCGDFAGHQVFATASFVYVVAGGGCGDPPMMVNRFNLSGVLDTAYGDDGHVLVDPLGGSIDLGGYATMQSGGRIVGFVDALGPVTEDGVAFRLAGSDPVALAGSFVSLPPARILDTRNGTGAPAGTIPGGGSIDLQVTGHGGVPATGVGAVVLNLTVTQPTWDGSVVAYPTGQPKPLASNLNFAQDQTIPNLVTVKLGTAGKVTLTNNQIPGKTLHLVADVAGYYLSGTATAKGTFVPLTPVRVLDTRNGTGGFNAPVAAHDEVQLGFFAAGVPEAWVSAVVMNVTVTQPTWDGSVVAYPTGTTPPLASNLNFKPNITIPNLVIAKLGGGLDKTIRLRNNSIQGTVHLIVDVSGYFNN